MAKKENSLETYIDEATKNITQDRAVASVLLIGIVTEIQTNTKNHKDYGEIASRYLETLQRSNEQLVKLAAIIQRRESTKEGLSGAEKDELFDAIKDD